MKPLHCLREKVGRCQGHFNTACTALAPLFDLALRLYIARVFILSGLTKLSSWEGTLYLFTSEYHVPVLPPLLAAVMATTGELLLPVLLVLGLAGRFAVAGLLVVNAMAVISYYPEMGDLGLKDHILWGVMLLMLLFHGLGKWSLDHWLGKTAHH